MALNNLLFCLDWSQAEQLLFHLLIVILLYCCLARLISGLGTTKERGHCG